MASQPDDYQELDTIYDGQLHALDQAPAEPVGERWLTCEQAGELLGVESARVLALIRAGRLHARQGPGDGEPTLRVNLDEIRGMIDVYGAAEALRRFAGDV